MSTILVANNHWSNIGDAFYQLAVISDLQSVFKKENVISGEESSCHLDSFSRFYRKNIFDYSLFGESDWYVLSGPILTSSFGSRYSDLLKELKGKKIKLVLISVGGLRYTSEEVNHCRKILKEYPPYILSTRDTRTFETYKDLATHSYDGICSAFYSSMQFHGYSTPELKDYVVYAFDQYLEPKMEISRVDRFSVKLFGDIGKKFSRNDYIRDMFRGYPDSTEGLKIIRLQHDTIGKSPSFIYRRPNTFVSLNPYAYLNIIKNSSLVLGSRLHASVIALSYQVPTMYLIKNSNRASLLERVGLDRNSAEPMMLDQDLIRFEHEKFLNFLENCGI